MKTLAIILLILLLTVGMGVTLYNFTQFYISLNTLFAKVGYTLIFIFTLLIISRYMLLLFFSLLQLLFRITDIELKKQTRGPMVSIIVPAYNESKVIAKSIESLLLQQYENIELIIVDDGSKDETFLIAKQYEGEMGAKSVKVFRKPNGGKSRAINFGIEHSSGELILVVDADSKLNSDAVELLVRHFENDEIAAVAGSVYITNQVNIWTKLQALEYIEGLNMVRNGQALVKAVNIIPGPIGMFRKSALYDVGLYDHDTFAEDCDVTLKLIAKGYKIDFEPEAVAYTEAPESLLDLIKQRYRWTRGILQAIRKHAGLLVRPRGNVTATVVLWYMLFESILWPTVDVWVNAFIVFVSLTQGVSLLVFYWWMIFTIMDMAAALFCVLVTGERLSLVFYAAFYRLFFVEIINTAKILATIEEFVGVKMEWGKLERKGRL